MRKLLPTALLLVTLAAPGFASTRNHYHRVDRAIRSQALSILAEEGVATDGVTVRCERRRLLVYGSLGDAARREHLGQRLRAQSRALSVVLS